MRCTKCGFISFDHYTACTRCKADLSELHNILRGSSIKVALPLFLAPALQEVLREGDATEESAQDVALAALHEPELVSPEAVAAELESQAILDNIMASVSSQATLKEEAKVEEVPTIDLGQFEEQRPEEEAQEAELPVLDLGFALETGDASADDTHRTDGDEELAATAPVPEFSGLTVELPSELETPKSEEATEDGLPELELSFSEEPVTEPDELTLKDVAVQEEAAQFDDDLSLGLEEINLADLVPDVSLEVSSASGQGGIDFNMGMFDLKPEPSTPEAKTEGDVFDLSSIMEEPGEEPNQDISPDISGLADSRNKSGATNIMPPVSERLTTGKAGGIPFKLEIEKSHEEPPSASKEKDMDDGLDGLELLPDLDLKLEEDK